MDPTSAMDRAVARLRAASAAFDAELPAVEAGRPWPLHDADHDSGPESAWGPTEVLAHVAEMLQFWLGEIERVVDGGPGPVPFGRMADDPIRILTLARDRTLPPRELVDRIESTVERYAHRLPELTDADAARRGLHPRRGEMTLAEALEQFAVVHAEEHVVQLRAALAEAGGRAFDPEIG